MVDDLVWLQPREVGGTQIGLELVRVILAVEADRAYERDISPPYPCVLELIEKESPYEQLEAAADQIVRGLDEALGSEPHVINREGSLFSLFFSDEPVTDYVSAKRAGYERFARFFHGMLDRGVYLPPSGFEGWFLTTVHGDTELDRVVAAAGEAISRS